MGSQLALHITRVLPAPRSRVYRALTEPDEIAQWWGPRGFTLAGIEVDLRVGGSYRFAMQPPDGEVFYLVGEYVQVDPAARLAYTFRYEDPDPEDQENLVTLSLEELGNQTEMTFTQKAFATEARRKLHEAGWTDSLDRLEEMLSATG